MACVVFICGPNAGMMDMWLPVICSLRRKRPDADLWCFFSTTKNAKDFGRTISVLREISEETFDNFASPSPLGGYVAAKNIGELVDIIQHHELIERRVRVLLDFVPIGERIRHFSLEVALLAYRTLKIEEKLEGLVNDCKIVLSDLYMLRKGSPRTFFTAWKSAQWYSLLHGINLLTDTNLKMKTPDLTLLPKKIVAFLFSDREIVFYANQYGLKCSQMRVVGVPRHEKSWITYIKDREMVSSEWEKSRYVFLISRGIGGPLPAQRKREYLVAIREVVCKELGLELIIKTHPNAGDETVYQDVFGDEEGVCWAVEGRHPLVLGANCIFGISFYSGVPMDLLRLGVPTIEYLDLSGIPDYDNPDSMRSEDGEAILVYRKHGLVLGASTREQLKIQIQRILTERALVLQELNEAYRMLYEVKPDVTSEMADIISRSLPSGPLRSI